ncbi:MULTISPECIES: hypothetical protein [Winogradskyella]|uniref:DUF7677 family protein n=1 Tax=Winogradskyella TaxID=286104 RepID=UPI0015C7F432|nr:MULTISPECIES: hypothetical protein [Winogradskyella]QXP78696.1 hypothetical protein H0I32_16055 [Winogradskyella sp. HaHa_3_26]QXP78824.1 hypothetical protein H0I32_16710 [Winogradskyella sp. HaHa_3_26]
MKRLDTKSKADIRFFTFYLLNGTLDFDLLNNKLKTNHISFFNENPNLLFESFCVFANHKQRNSDSNRINKRVAEYICKSIEPDNFQIFNNFEKWELNFDFDGNDFANSLKDFANRLSFDKIDKLRLSGNMIKDCITYGATFWETVFVIWANNLEFINEKIVNQEYAIKRAVQWYIDNEKVEDWELELEM